MHALACDSGSRATGNPKTLRSLIHWLKVTKVKVASET